MAELIADELRSRILRGELGNGDHLAKEEELREEFNVSKASMREALLILDTEGLITVRRGKIGGSVVHLPTPDNAAYTLGLVLNAQHADAREVGLALRVLEPQCAAMCAARTDRHEEVVPRLRKFHDLMVERLDDGQQAIEASRQFHETIVEGCGNRAMTLVVGALERIWTAHERTWAERALRSGCFPHMDDRHVAVIEHQRVLDAIDKGDVAEVIEASRVHLETSQAHQDDDVPPLIDLSSLRPPQRR
jgi:DNA-binding FadR family transcriptional regulator